MNLPVFPDELDPPLRQSYKEGMAESRRFTQPEQGPMRAARKYSRADGDISIEFICSRALRAVFERFYVEKIAEGALPFLMRDYGTDGWLFLTEDGTPLLDGDDKQILLSEWRIVMMRTLPQISPAGIEWMIQFTVAVKPS
jgi:hypothetical protein